MDAETLEMIDRRIAEAVGKAIKEERKRLVFILENASALHSGQEFDFEKSMRLISREINSEGF